MHDSWRGGHGTVLSSDSLSSTTILLPLFLSFPFLVLLFLFSPLSRVNFQTCTNRLHVSSCRCKYKRMEFNSSIGRCLRYVLWSVSKRVSLRSEERKREHTRAGLVDKFHARWESFSFYARCSPVRIEGGRKRQRGGNKHTRQPQTFFPVHAEGLAAKQGSVPRPRGSRAETIPAKRAKDFRVQSPVSRTCRSLPAVLLFHPCEKSRVRISIPKNFKNFENFRIIFKHRAIRITLDRVTCTHIIFHF